MKLKIALIQKAPNIAPYLARALVSDCCRLLPVQNWASIEQATLLEADCVIALYDLRDCGRASIERIREIAAVKPIVVLSSSAQQSAAIDCFRAGAADFIPLVEVERGPFLSRLEAAVVNWWEQQSSESHVNQRLCQLLRQSETDSLTGLSNRHFFDRIIAQTPQLDRRKPLGLIIIDVDNFKQINDRFGHHAGDAVLKDLATLIRSHLNPGDAAIRWGGEESLALCAAEH